MSSKWMKPEDVRTPVTVKEGEAALRDRVEAAIVAARGDVDRAAEALGWTTAALETLLRDHPHWWPREELGPRG